MAMLKGVAHYERTHQGWDSFHDDQAKSQIDPRWLRNKKWDGVISRHTTAALVQSCAELKLPLVDLNDCPSFPGVPKIRPDNTGIGHFGAEHFIERGYHHFAFSGFANNSWSCERRDGFVEALGLAGHTCQVHDVEYPGDITPIWDAKQIATMCAWLKKLPKPVAVMACNDMRALEVLGGAQAAGMLVPEEVAILGVNNDIIRCDLAYPPLSSVATNAFQSGYQSAELLTQLINGQKPEKMERRMEAIGVVTRPSSDILAINDKNVALALSYIRENASQGISVEQVLKHAFASRSQLIRFL